MPGDRDKASENPYEAPQVEPSDPSPHQGSCWLGALGLLSAVLAVAFMFREFGVAGLSMMIGGMAGMGLASMSKRLWVTAIGAVVGFTGGTVVGIVIEITYGML